MVMMKKLFVFICLFLSVFPGGFSVNAQEAQPDAMQLMKRVRQAATLQEDKEVSGQIRRRGVKIPFTMALQGSVISFRYELEKSKERFDLKFKEKGQEIDFYTGNKPAKLSVEKYAQPIAETDVAYEDLSLRYLYWPNAKIIKDDDASVVKGRECWILLIPNPNRKVGQYAWVRLWIDKENGAMWQLDGINADGKLAKRFLIDSVMKLKDGSWFFKRIKVEKRDPQNSHRTISVSYIDMEDPE